MPSRRGRAHRFRNRPSARDTRKQCGIGQPRAVVKEQAILAHPMDTEVFRHGADR